MTELQLLGWVLLLTPFSGAAWAGFQYKRESLRKIAPAAEPPGIRADVDSTVWEQP